MSKPISLGVLLIVFAGVCVAADLVHHTAPDFQLQDASGKQISLGSFKNKIVVLDFWATWCPPCRRSLPALQRLYEQYKDKGVVILGINLEGPSAKVLHYINENHLTFPIVFDCCDFEAPVLRKYQVTSIPKTFLIDGRQMVRLSDHPNELTNTGALDSLLREGESLGEHATASPESTAEYWVKKGADLNDNSETAAQYYRRALTIDPNNYKAHHALGLLYKNQKRFPALAVTEFLAASMARPKDAHIYAHIGDVYVELNEPSKAIEAYRSYLSRTSPEAKSNAQVFHDLGKLLEEQGSFEEAMANFKRSLEAGPPQERDDKHLDAFKADIHIHLGRMLRRRQLYTENAKELDLALSFAPNSSVGLREVARLHMARGENANAISVLQRAVESAKSATDTAYEETLHLLGQAFESDGRAADARRQYAELVRLKPNDEHYRNHLKSVGSTEALSARPAGPITAGAQSVQLPADAKLSLGDFDATLNDGQKVRARVARDSLVFLGDPPTWQQGLNRLVLPGRGEIIYALREATGKIGLFRPFQKSYALVIAIGNYSEDTNGRGMVRLPFARNVVTEVAKTLRLRGFDEVWELPDATRSDIESSIRSIAAKTSQDDRLLIYFMGHGVTHQVVTGVERGYLVPSDGKRSDPFTLIAMSDFQEKFALTIPAKHILFILDACYSGLALTYLGDTDISAPTQSEIMVRCRDKGRHILAAGEADQRSLAAPELGSTVFSYYFVKAIRDGEADVNPRDGVITLDELSAYVKKNVIQDASRKGHVQKPHLDRIAPVVGGGEFLFLMR